MPQANPFPLPESLSNKVNSPALLAWFQQFGTDGYLSAEEIKAMKAGLDYLYENMGAGPGATPTLPQVLSQGDRTIRLSDGDGETILELNDQGKLLYNQDGDFLMLPADLYPVNTVLKIHNIGTAELYCIPDVDNNPSISINGANIDEFTPIVLQPGTAVLKKVNGDSFSETWILTYEVLDFSREALGLNLVDNTPDNSKPVSTAQATAIANAQSAAQTYAKNYTDNIRLKQPARLAVDVNVSSLNGQQTFQSITVSTGDIILLMAQTNQKENGLWLVNGLGAWTRPEDFRNGLDVSFVSISVLGGTYRGRVFATGAGRIVGDPTAVGNITIQENPYYLNGISFSDGTDITAANNLLEALGKLQKQLTDVRAAKEDKRSYMSQSSPRFLENTPALQKIFNVGSSGNGSLPVTAGRKYRVVGWAVFSALSGSSKNIGFGILGTATASYVSGIAQGLISSAVSTPQLQALTSFSQTQICSNSNLSIGKIYFDFEFNCNGSGNIIPSVAFSISVANMQVDSAYCEIVDIGSSSSTSTSNIV